MTLERNWEIFFWKLTAWSVLYKCTEKEGKGISFVQNENNSGVKGLICI